MKLVKSILRNIFFLIIKINFISYIVSWIIYKIILIDNKNFKSNKKVNILALSSYRFRGDLQILQKVDEINVIVLPLGIQYFLFSKYSENILKKNFLFKKKNEPIYDYEKDLKKIFDRMLNLSLKNFNINIALSASLTYLQDSIYFDFLRSKKIKVVINTREYVGIQKKQIEYFDNYLNKFNLFEPDLINCQNESTKNIYKKKIKNQSSKIISLGTLRMDKFLDKIKNIKKHTNDNKKRKNIVFFSFLRNVGLYYLKDGSTLGSNDRDGLNNFFKNVHNILINFAKHNSEYDLFIKPKMGGHFIKEIKDAWKSENIDPIPENCHITIDEDPQDLILNADLVVTFNSSTVLESGLRNIPILIPAFDETVDEYKDYFDFSVYEKGFDIVKNKELFPILIKKRLSENNNISQDQMKKRYELFENYLSSMNGNVTSNFVKELNDLL